MSVTLRPEDFFKCPSCGNQITIFGDACPFCGAAKPQGADLLKDDKSAEQGSTKSKFGCGLVTLCIACLGAAGAFLVAMATLGLPAG